VIGTLKLDSVSR